MNKATDLMAINFTDYNFENTKEGMEQDGIGYSFEDYLEETVDPDNQSSEDHKEDYEAEYESRLNQEAHDQSLSLTESLKDQASELSKWANANLDFREIKIDDIDGGFNITSVEVDRDDLVSNNSEETLSIAQDIDKAISNTAMFLIHKNIGGTLVSNGEVHYDSSVDFKAKVEQLVETKGFIIK